MSDQSAQEGPALRKAVSSYLNDRVELLRLEMAEKTARLSAGLVVGAIVAMLGFFLLLFLSLMAGYFFSQLTDSLFAGFAIVAGAYLLMLVWLLTWGKKKIGTWVSDAVVRIFYEEAEPEKANDAGA